MTLQTNENVHSIVIPPKATVYGSSANGGEMPFLALDTCYCNDICREAAKMMEFTDPVAEIQNTLRIETPVVLSRIEVVKIG
jgi:hypothetical protein